MPFVGVSAVCKWLLRISVSTQSLCYRSGILARARLSLLISLGTLSALLLLAACTGPFTNPPAALSGHLQIDGSTALQPLVSKAATLFQQEHPQVRINVSGGGSITGLNDVTSHKVDIGNSDIYADPATRPPGSPGLYRWLCRHSGEYRVRALLVLELRAHVHAQREQW